MKQLYFIAIPIPSPYSDDIIALKEDFVKRFESSHSLKSIPHITLQMPVRLEEEHEPELLETLRNVPKKISIDEIRLNNTGHFSDRTIYINVRKEGLVVMLFNAVTKVLKELNWFPRKYNAKRFNPHITLMTRDLTSQMYQKAWEEIQNMKFEWEMKIDRFCVFKHDGEKWRILAVIVLRD